MKNNNLFDDADMIYSYSRSQAIKDGILVDLSHTSEYHELGFRFPLAVTQAVYDRCIEVPANVPGQDRHGRLWDVLWMLRLAIQKCEPSVDTTFFFVHVRNSNRPGTPPAIQLKAVVGPGDNGRPVITVMLPLED